MKMNETEVALLSALLGGFYDEQFEFESDTWRRSLLLPDTIENRRMVIKAQLFYEKECMDRGEFKRKNGHVSNTVKLVSFYVLEGALRSSTDKQMIQVSAIVVVHYLRCSLLAEKGLTENDEPYVKEDFSGVRDFPRMKEDEHGPLVVLPDFDKENATVIEKICSASLKAQ